MRPRNGSLVNPIIRSGVAARAGAHQPGGRRSGHGDPRPGTHGAARPVLGSRTRCCASYATTGHQAPSFRSPVPGLRGRVRTLREPRSPASGPCRTSPRTGSRVPRLRHGNHPHPGPPATTDPGPTGHPARDPRLMRRAGCPTTRRKAMCRLFGLSSAPRRTYATFWLLDAPDSLSRQSHRDPDGTGLGHFAEDGAPRVDKAPIAAYRDRVFAEEARQVESATFVAHVRSLSGVPREGAEGGGHCSDVASSSPSGLDHSDSRHAARPGDASHGDEGLGHALACRRAGRIFCCAN